MQLNWNTHPRQMVSTFDRILCRCTTWSRRRVRSTTWRRSYPSNSRRTSSTSWAMREKVRLGQYLSCEWGRFWIYSSFNHIAYTKQWQHKYTNNIHTNNILPSLYHRAVAIYQNSSKTSWQRPFYTLFTWPGFAFVQAWMISFQRLSPNAPLNYFLFSLTTSARGRSQSLLSTRRGWRISSQGTLGSPLGYSMRWTATKTCPT